MATKQAGQDFIVVHDGLPRIGPDGENLASAPGSASISPTKSPATERPRRSTTTTITRQVSQRRSDGGFNDTLDPLRALPELRPIPWYAGKELTTDKAVESTRVQTRGACLLVSRGKVIDPPCNHCATGVGRFSQCVALEDWFHGACATCQLATRGNLCSLRKGKEVAIKDESEQQGSPSAEMPGRQKTHKAVDNLNTPASQSRKASENQSQSEPRPPAAAAAALRSARRITNSPMAQSQDMVRPIGEHSSQSSQSSQPLKRKRETLQGTSVYRPYVSPYAPLDPPNRLASSLPNTPIIPPAPNMIIPAKIARDQSAYHNYMQQREIQQNGGAPQQGFRAVNAPSTVVNGNRHRNSPTIIETSRNSNMSRGKNQSESLSPSAQLLQPLQSPTPEPPANRTKSNQEPTRMTTRNTQKNNNHSNGSVTQPPSTIKSSRITDPADSPLIDTLPRRKQKQIYGIIGGLQSGIRSCQQQAESMQKQLDLLQASLGIDLDHDKDVSMTT